MTLETSDTPIRRRPDGSIDAEHYIERAASMRCHRQGAALKALFRPAARLLHPLRRQPLSRKTCPAR
jgi:hypothetical protein